SKISTRTLLLLASCTCGGLVAVAIVTPLSASSPPALLPCGRSAQASSLSVRESLRALSASRPSRGACSQLLLHAPQVVHANALRPVRQLREPPGRTCI